MSSILSEKYEITNSDVFIETSCTYISWSNKHGDLREKVEEFFLKQEFDTLTDVNTFSKALMDNFKLKDITAVVTVQYNPLRRINYLELNIYKAKKQLFLIYALPSQSTESFLNTLIK